MKSNHQKIISDVEYVQLPFKMKLLYRYTNIGAPNLGNPSESPHIPIRPDPSSYIDHWPIDPHAPKLID